MEKVHGKVEALCEMCLNGLKCVAFCRNCVQFICEGCINVHKTIKAYSGHKISTLDELKQGQASALHSEEAPPSVCEAHDEAKKLYCFECDRLICRDCILIDHVGHKYQFVRKAAPEIRKKIIDYITPLSCLLSDMQRAADGIKSVKKAIEANGKSVSGQIGEYYQELHKIIDDGKGKLLEDSAKLIDERVAVVSAQEKNIDLSIATIQSLIAFVEKTLSNSSNEEVITMHSHILTRIQGELEEQKQGVVATRPNQCADLQVKLSIATELQKLCAGAKLLVGAQDLPKTSEGIIMLQCRMHSLILHFCTEKTHR